MQKYKPEGISRADALIRSAKVRAAIAHWLNHAVAPVTKAQLYEQISDDIDAAKSNMVHFESTLYAMVTNHLVVRESGLDAKNPVYLSYNLKTQSPTKETEKKVKHVATSTKEIKVDVVKSTGRVRLTISGLTIDIGVINA